MLERTFLHVPGIGYSTERRLWAWGADSWQDFLAAPARFRLSQRCLPPALKIVSSSPGALARGDYRFFARALAFREHWRALDAFPGRLGYVDIETDGGTDFDSITVIGLSDGANLRHFVCGENLLDFEEAAADVALWVTFNGASFDLPILREAFPRVRFDGLHLDLCHALRRLGYRGGLKAVEQQVGIGRSAETTGLTGWDAVRLWREWRWGSEDALRVLLAYNGEDVLNMVPLARLAADGLRHAASGEQVGRSAGILAGDRKPRI